MISLILRLISRVYGLFGQAIANREFGEEIGTHLELLTERLIRQGMSREDAVCVARRQFGNVGLVQERQREAQAFPWITTVFQDVRYGLRMLAKNRGVTAIAITSLALGIGANTLIFTVAKAALFDALSVPRPEQLRLLAFAQGDRSVLQHDTWGDFYSDAHGRTVLASFSYPIYQALRHQDHSLGDLFAFVDLSQFEHLSATIDGRAEVVTAELVSGNFFQRIGVGTVLGRPIAPADDAIPGSGAVAVISDSFWARRFNRSPSVIGQTIDVNLTPVMIIGVAPRGFSGASRVHTPQDLFMPLSMQPVVFPRETGSLLSDSDTWWIQIMGRQQPGISGEEGRASLAVSFSQAVRSTMTIPKDRTVPPLLLLPGDRGWNYAAQELEHPMPYLLALAGFVLLLSCVNVANLLLARSSSRIREISVRLALGAGKTRVVGQMLTESLCLSALGGSAGLLIGYLGRNLLPQMLSPSWGPPLSTRFDWRVFAFTCVISMLTGLGFGVGPAWQATRTCVIAGLRDGGRTMTDSRKGIAGKTLVILQVSLCMLLLVSAGLFLRTLANLNALDPGFNKRGLLLFAIEPPVQRYPAPENVEVLHQVEQKVASLPGVQSVTLSKEALLAQSRSESDFLPDGRLPISGRDQHVPFNSVGQSFFTTMGIPILYGRPFDSRDTSNSPGVAVINAALARKQLAGTNPIGAFFRMKEGGEPFEIVGECADAKYAWLRSDVSPTFYVLYTQQKELQGGMTFEVRTRGNPRGFAGAIRVAVESVDKDLPLIDVRTQEDQIEATIGQERSFAMVTTGFGILALVLASIGVYGVVAAGVSRRVNEIGVRMALGARADQVVRMVISEAMSLTFLGICGGVCSALLVTRLWRSLLFGLKPTDLLTLAGAGLMLSVVALLASWAPAHRASRIQPVRALRHE